MFDPNQLRIKTHENKGNWRVDILDAETDTVFASAEGFYTEVAAIESAQGFIMHNMVAAVDEEEETDE